MRNLADITFPPVLDTSSGDIIRDFFNPALGAAVRYDRGVGFFSAAWLRLASLGMPTTILNLRQRERCRILKRWKNGRELN